VLSGEEMDWCEGVDREGGKNAKRLTFAPKTRRRAGAGCLDGEAGVGTCKTTKLALGPRLIGAKR
jgi:hypothetical protein